MKILLVGSLSACHSDPRISGTVISLKYLIDELKAHDGVELAILDTGGLRRSRGLALFHFLKIIFKFFLLVPTADVISLHISPNGLSIFGPLAIIAKKLFNKPVVIRLFGGLDYADLSPIKYAVADYVVRRSDEFLVQSKALVRVMHERGITHVSWFPTTRPMPIKCNSPSCSDGKFIFIAQIKREKGIFELIEAAKRIGHIFQVDVYGPFYDGLNDKIFSDVDNVHYHGVARPEDVPMLMQSAKALIFPTYMPAEGYPGVVLEAFSVGLPVICSNWKYLPEIVDSSCGIFFEPKDTESLCKALIIFMGSKDLREKLSCGAFMKRKDFSLESATNRFLACCDKVKYGC